MISRIFSLICDFNYPSTINLHVRLLPKKAHKSFYWYGWQSQKVAIFSAFVLALLLDSVPAAGELKRDASSFRFALFGDPQIGYGPGGMYADSSRFFQIIEHSNSAKLPLIVIPGDLVQKESIWQSWAFLRGKAAMNGHVLLTPGNHDVNDTASLQEFRDNFGSDYHDYVYRNCAFILINSETARAPDLSQHEFDKQWRWIEKTVEHHAQANRNHIFIITHRPPFINQEREGTTYSNWPIDTRMRLLGLARLHGVRWILSGHLHRNHMVVTTDGIRLIALPGTARSSDRTPIGYGVFDVSSDSVRYTFEEVAPAPKLPFSVPGFRSWTPRLFDFSLRHWILTVAFLCGAIAAFMGRQRLIRMKSINTTSGAHLWGGIGALMAFYGLNMQLDFDEFIAEIGRIAAKLTGIYHIRHAITGIALLVFVVVVLVYFIRHFRRAKYDLKTTVAILVMFFPSVWFCLCAISNHDIGLLFDEAWWDLLNLSAIIVVIITSILLRSSSLKGTQTIEPQ